MFTYSTRIRLGDTDAAGVLYFNRLLDLAHAAYEDFMRQAGCDLPALLREGVVSLPIVHAEVDCKSPLRWGDEVEVQVDPTRVGRTSFQISYRILGGPTLAATAATVHVAVRSKTGRPCPIPFRVRRAITRD